MQAKDLVTHTPREGAGASTVRAFDFQLHFSISKVLEAYIAGDEFVALFDHFDDLVLVRGANDDEISFYQVKSKANGGWTPAALAKRGVTGDLPKSIIGKAYYNIHQFGSAIRRACITSNQPLNATYETEPEEEKKHAKPDDGEIVFGSLCAPDRAVLDKALALDFPSGIDTAHQNILTFERTPLDLGSYRDTVLGRVALFANAVDPTGGASPKPIYDTLLSEAVRCTGDRTKAKSLQELKARKGLARNDIESLVDRLRKRVRNVLEWWDAVGAEMAQDGQGALTQQRVKGRCLSYWLARQRGSPTAFALSAEITAHVAAHTSLIGGLVMSSVVALRLAGGPAPPEGEPFDLEAAYVVELMEQTA